MRDDRERLADILEAIERIEKYAVRGRTGQEGFTVWPDCPGNLQPHRVGVAFPRRPSRRKGSMPKNEGVANWEYQHAGSSSSQLLAAIPRRSNTG